MRKIDILSPVGLMPSEVDAIAAIENNIPQRWKGYASFYVNDQKNSGMEIDLLLVTDDRLLLCELKNWAGEIKSDGKYWHQYVNERKINSHPSPVGIKRSHAERLKGLLKKDLMDKWGCFYEVHSIVIMCNPNAKYEFTSAETNSIMTLKDFLTIKDEKIYKKKFSEINQYAFQNNSRKRPNDNQQLKILKNWLRGTSKSVSKKFISYQSYQVKDKNPIFQQKLNDPIYKEYEGQHKNHAHYQSLMRVWDFKNMGSYGYTSQNRANIALREFRVQAHIESQFGFVKTNYLLQPLHSFDPDLCTEDLVEIYRKNPLMERLDDYIKKVPNIIESKIELIKKLITPFSSLHNINVAHRDISLERLWFDSSSKSIIISGFAAAKFPYVDGNKSISDVYKEVLSTPILPLEYVEEDFKDDIDPFKVDVFQLGVICYEILFNKKIYINLDKNNKKLIEWIEPEDNIFNQKINEWIKKSISLFSDDRFKNAQEMLSEFTNINEEEKLDSYLIEENIMGELNAYKKEIIPYMHWIAKPETTKQDPVKGSVEFLTIINEKDFIVKNHINLKPIVGKDGENRKILSTLRKCRDISSNTLNFPKIEEFGWGIMGGFYIVQEHLTLPKLNSFTYKEFKKEEIKDIAITLINGILFLHDLNYFHGDLKPDNILLSFNKEGCKSIIIDLIDFDFNNNKPFNNVYSVGINSNGYERDRYACYKIIKELINFSNDFDVVLKEINQGIGEKEDRIPPSLTMLKESFDNQDDKEKTNELIQLNIYKKELNEEDFFSDQGKYYINFYKVDDSNKNEKKLIDVTVTGKNKEIRLRLEVADTRLKLIFAFLREIKPHEVVNKSITAFRNNYSYAESIEANISISKSYGNTVIDFIENLDSYENFINDNFKVENTNKIISKHIQKLNKEKLIKLWADMLDSENDLKPSLKIVGAIDYDYDRKTITIPVAPLSLDLSEYSNEPVDVIDIQKSINYGVLNHFMTDLSNGILVVETKFSKNTIEKNNPNLLKLIPKQESSSQFRRKKALDRVLKGESLIPNLIEYFVEGESYKLSQDDNSTPILEENILEIYRNRLLPKQFDALKYILENKISVVMGPPGTGKTTLLGHLLDYLNRVDSVSRILIVSQSNVAVDELATKARKVIREIALESNMDPDSVLPTIVRLGHKEKVIPELLDIHVDALQSQYRTQFHRDFEKRLLTFSSRLHLTKEFIQDAINIYHHIGREIFEYINARVTSRNLEEIIADSPLVSSFTKDKYETVLQQFKRLNSILLNKLTAYVDDPEAVIEEENPLFYLLNDLGRNHGINNPNQLSKFIEVLKLSHDWLDRLSTDYGGFASFMANSREWIVGTLVGIGKPSYQIVDKKYDLVIIDEAGRASANELAMAMQSAKKIVLVGDHLQLPPLYDKKMVKNVAKRLELPIEEIVKTDFERALNVTKGIMLENQFRMAQEISDIVSTVIYEKIHGKQLITSRECAPSELESLHVPWNKVVSWVDTSDQIKMETHENKNISNDVEVNIICNLVKDLFESDTTVNLFNDWLLKDHDNPTIGIITGYSEQVRKINSKFQTDMGMARLKKYIRVDTIDSYQGSENRIIILSLVRNNNDNKIGFMDEFPRINVAISRAKERLIIIGAARMFEDRTDDNCLTDIYNFIKLRSQDINLSYQIIESKSLVKG